MPDLLQSLQGRDLGHLRIIAELWGIEFSAPDAHVGMQRLAPLLLSQERVDEILSTLPQEAMQALDDLVRAGGRMPWAVFTRRFGELREMGPGRRDRERPYAGEQASACEALWYRGLVGRGFFDDAAGPQEYAFIPDDLLAFLPVVETHAAAPLGRPASAAERVRLLPATDILLDDACSMLAGLRAGLPLAEIEPLLRSGKSTPAAPLSGTALVVLLKTAGLLNQHDEPMPEPTRIFLEAEPGQALVMLFEAWLRSVDFNELRLAPGLVLEGQWTNDPLHTRQMVLDFLSTVPGSLKYNSGEVERPFWSLGAFISSIYQRHPDFQRPAGDYDSWYIRDAASGEFLRGFTHWDAVDGALLRFVISGPLHWLGVLDLAGAENNPAQSAFRFSAWAAELLNFQAPQGLPAGDEQPAVRSDGRIRLLPQSRRDLRYQVGRFCEWQGFSDGFYRYRVTPASLERARAQGLRADHLLGLLNRHAKSLPPTLVTAIKRWESHGSLARHRKSDDPAGEEPGADCRTAGDTRFSFLGREPGSGGGDHQRRRLGKGGFGAGRAGLSQRSPHRGWGCSQ